MQCSIARLLYVWRFRILFNAVYFFTATYTITIPHLYQREIYHVYVTYDFSTELEYLFCNATYQGSTFTWGNLQVHAKLDIGHNSQFDKFSWW